MTKTRGILELSEVGLFFALEIIRFNLSLDSFVFDSKERAWNKFPNDSEGFLFPVPHSREAHSRATQRLREWGCEQKDKLESGSYFVHVPKATKRLYRKL